MTDVSDDDVLPKGFRLLPSMLGDGQRLHASSKATAQGRRRVLHLLFEPRELQFSLQWRRAI